MSRSAASFWPGAVAVLLCAFVSPDVHAQCITPPQYTNVTTSVAGDLHFVMGTDVAQCEIGEPVMFLLSVYNAGPATVTIPNPAQISAIHSWSVLPDTCQTPYEPEGCAIDTPFLWPQGVFFFGLPTDIAPGECKTYTTTWDGLHSSGNPDLPVNAGFYRVVGGFLIGWDETTSQGAPLPEMVVPLRILLSTSGVPVSPASWSAIKSRFE